MQKIAAFTLEQHSGPYQAWPRKTRLFFDGADTGTAINGYEIEAQYQCAQGYLLITSYDCPFEESNEFILLDKDFKVIAQRSLMAMYDSYLLDSHWPISDQALQLQYYPAINYTLSIKTHRGIFGSVTKLRLQRFQKRYIFTGLFLCLFSLIILYFYSRNNDPQAPDYRHDRQVLNLGEVTKIYYGDGSFKDPMDAILTEKFHLLIGHNRFPTNVGDTVYLMSNETGKMKACSTSKLLCSRVYTICSRRAGSSPSAKQDCDDSYPFKNISNNQ